MRFLLKSTFNSCKDKKKVIWCSPNYREPKLRSRALTKELALLTNQLTQDQYTVVIWGIKSFLKLTLVKTGIYVITGVLKTLYTPSFFYRNQGNHQNLKKSMVPHKLWLIWKRMKQKKIKIADLMWRASM